MVRSYSLLSGCRGALLAALVSASAFAKESSPGAASPALDLARQLNQAFIEVADSVSKSVVVIKVKTKEDREGGDLQGNPLYEQLPEEQRQQFERLTAICLPGRGAT